MEERQHEKELPLPTKRSTAFLDGLRGVAALCVFNTHLMGGGWHERGWGQLNDEGTERNWMLISAPIIRIFYVGAPAAVSIFFVLSGFVITQSLVKLLRNERHGDFVKSICSAMVRRPFRLYLPCFAITAMIALALHLPYGFYSSVPWLHPADTLGEEIGRVIRECYSFFNPFKHHGEEGFFIYDLVVWTIPIELQGSFLCYGLLAMYALATRDFGINSPINNWSVGCLALLTAWLLYLGLWWQACFVAGFTLSIVDIFALDQPLLGRSFVMELDRQLWDVQASTLGLYAVLISSGLLLSVIQTAGHPEWAQQTPGYAWLDAFVPKAYEGPVFYRFWTSVGAIGFVYATLRISWLQSFFNTRPLRFLGKVSFMLYLIHLPVAYCFSDRWLRMFGHVSFGSEPKWWDHLLWLPDWGVKGLNVRWVVCYASVLGVNLVLANALTKHIDEPTVRLSKEISGSLGLNSSKPAMEPVAAMNHIMYEPDPPLPR